MLKLEDYSGKRLNYRASSAFLDAAIRRFSYAHERHRAEDKIIDLLIAAEALFLCDLEEKGELSYRLSVRAAFFIGGSNLAECRKVYEIMRAAYKLRSAIVHGDEWKKIKLPEREDKSRMNMEDFIFTIQEYVRTAIRKAINLGLQPNTPRSLINWNDLIFGTRVTDNN